MTILGKLIKIANELDKKGAFEEADEIDKILKNIPPPCTDCEGTGWTEEGWKNRDPQCNIWEGDCESCDGTGIKSKTNDMANDNADIFTTADSQMVSTFSPEKGTEIYPSQKIQTWIWNLKILRKFLGLPEQPKNGKQLFDKDVAIALKTKYPGVWIPGAKQTPAALIEGIKHYNTKIQKSQTQQMPSQVGRGTEVGTPVTPSDKQLFPTPKIGPVKLPEKKEAPAPPIPTK